MTAEGSGERPSAARFLAASRPNLPRPALADGVTELPAGKIAAVATFLEIRRTELSPVPGGSGHHVQPLAGDLQRYRRLYGEIGEPWLWFSRAVLSDAELRSILHDPKVEASALVVDGRDTGLIELDFRQAGECELSFLGLVPSAVGQGLGPVLIAEAMRRAFAKPIERLWLHTCTLDHPSALPVYMKAGLRPYRRAIEVADDPRLSGHLPRTAGPGIPIL